MKNLGRLVNTVSGITGVSPGSVAVINLPVGQRYHRMVLQCQAVNYSAPTIALVGAGTYDATLTATVTNGVISAVAITAAGSGMTNGTYTSSGGGVKITDATGVGAQLSVVVASGAVSSVTIVSGGIPGPINPATLITSLRISVNGVVQRDITPAQILAIAAACGYLPQYGNLPILFTEPLRNMLRDNELTSWDLAGQSTFQIQLGIASGVSSPSITGAMEFDFNRNARPVKSAAAAKAQGVAIGTLVPFLQPVAQHSFTIPISSGRFDVTTLPWTKPQSRLWLLGSQPGNIYQVEVMQDGNLVYQATANQMAELAAEYGFQVGNPFYNPVTGGGYGAGSPGNGGVTSSGSAQIPTTIPNGTLAGSPWLDGTNLFPFDGAVIFDPDNRPWKALRCASSFVLRVYSNVSQNLTVIQETLPGAYTG